MKQKNKAIVYKIECEGKVYIGVTTNLSNRISVHKYAAKNNKFKKSKLYENIKKEKKINLEILEECNYHDRFDREKYWIKKTNSFKNGYNLSEGGPGASGRILSDDEKKKRSIASKAMWKNSAIREKIKTSLSYIFQNKKEQRRKGKLGALAKINKLPTKLCICKKTNKKIGEFKTSVQLSKLLQISHYQAEHYLRGKTKKALELYRFINKEFV